MQELVIGARVAQKKILTELPSVDRVLGLPAVTSHITQYGREPVLAAVRQILAEARAEILAEKSGSVDAVAWSEAALAQRLGERLQRTMQSKLRPVFNLTGTVLHTNLGRALLPEEAIQAAAAAMRNACNLEYDLDGGARGDRDDLVTGLLHELTGCEAATIVNNNAAAVFLALNALAARREVIVSRGEQIEIGGAFRLPDIMARAGCRLREVGTTNRTHLADYADAIGPKTGLILKVHTSNYVVQGFTAEVTEAALAPLAAAKGIPLATDLGSGSLMDMSRYGLPKEPTPQEMIAAGCDVVTFSGDKLLGGPQAGLIVGSQDAITKIKKFPMKRALRLSKLPLAALEATLRLYLQPELLRTHLPTLRWLTRSQADILNMAQTVGPAVQQAIGPRYEVRVQNMMSQIGSGSLPIDTLPSAGLSIAPKLAGKKGLGTALDQLEVALRALPTPVIGRIENDHILWDCRCLDHAQDLTNSLQFLKL